MLDYLTAIYKLKNTVESGATKVTTTMLAERMHVSPAAASSMSKRLEESGFVARSHDSGIQLSEQGRLAAMQMLRRHRLLEVFLLQVMEFTWDQVDVEAHRLEHAVSSAFEERMDKLCGYPTHCPHGDPIPSKDGVMPTEKLHPLTNLEPGRHGVVRRVASDDALVLRYLGQRALMPGNRVKVIEKEPFNGPVTLEISANVVSPVVNTLPIELFDDPDSLPPILQILGAELAAKIFVVCLSEA